jgi:hypothetical protein
MTTNAALAELESTADVREAKRDLVLRFVRDQESLQTSQVELKLVNDDTIDLMDSAFAANEIALQQNKEHTNNITRNNEDLLRNGVSGIALDDESKGLSSEIPMRPRPPSGRLQSRREHRKTSSEFKEKRKKSQSSLRSEVDRYAINRPMSSIPVHCNPSYNDDRPYAEMNSSAPLNSSWPQQVLSRKLSIGSSYRKCALYTPEKHLVLEAGDLENVMARDPRPMSSQRLQRIATREMIAARARKHSANDRITCNINQMVDSPVHQSRSTTPAKSTSRRCTSRSRTLINLGLEPVHPSEISMLRTASAGTSLSGPYTLVQLPPISRETPAATPPSS